MRRKEGESKFRVDAISSRETQCRRALISAQRAQLVCFCLGVRLRFEKVARAENLLLRMIRPSTIQAFVPFL